MGIHKQMAIALEPDWAEVMMAEDLERDEREYQMQRIAEFDSCIAEYQQHDREVRR